MTASKVSLLDAEAKGEPLPLLRLSVACISCVVASGFFPGQAVWIAVLAENGVFSSLCSGAQRLEGERCKAQDETLTAIFGVLGFASFAFGLPMGIIFDKRGAKSLGLMGGYANTVGYVLLFLAVLGASFGCDHWTCMVVVPSLIFAEFGMMMSSMALLGFMYHFPGYQTLIISLNNSANAAAAFVPLLLSGFLKISKWTLPSGMLLLCGVAVLAIPGIQWSGVDKDEMNLAAQRLTGLPIPRFPDPRFWSKVRTIHRILAEHACTHVAIVLVSSLQFAYGIFYATSTSAYSTALLGKDLGNYLASFNALAVGLLGVVVTPFAGVFADKYKTPSLLILCNTFGSLSVLFCCSTSFHGQLLAQFGSAMVYSILPTIMQKHIVCFCPSPRIGMAMGVITFVFAVLSMLIMAGMSVWSSELSGLRSFTQPLWCVGSLACVLSWLFAWHYFSAIPEQPVLPLEDEQEVCQMFGCLSMVQAEQILGLPRKQILKTLSSNDAQSVTHLLNGVDPSRAFEVVVKSTPPSDHPGDENWDGHAFLRSRLATLDNVDSRIKALGPEDLAAAVQTVAAAFNGHEPGFDWILGPSFRGDGPLKPKRQYYYEATFVFVLHVVMRFGSVLGIYENDMLVGVAAVFPPGRLIKNSEVYRIGGERYVYALQKLGSLPPFFDRSFGDGVRLRQAAALGDAGKLHETLMPGPHWYVAQLGVHPDYHGKRLGSALLDAVAALANQDGVPCYLETSGEKNVKVYTKNGYDKVYNLTVEVDDAAFEGVRSPPITMSLMSRPAGRC